MMATKFSNERIASAISSHLMEAMGIEVKVKVEQEELCEHGLILYGNKCSNCARALIAAAPTDTDGK